MAQIKVCPNCKKEDSTLIFYFVVMLQREGYIYIYNDGEESFEPFESNYEKEGITPSTPVRCKCGWLGLVKNLKEGTDD
ncbi:hypothetical protein LCGC14_2727970 [marine sediment metagenome]|uniref:Uncharacterized protein n=1 Tax=marine sediment metagenome TaxID=412755 RepID=A0A0F8Z8B7_9ZZZZ